MSDGDRLQRSLARLGSRRERSRILEDGGGRLLARILTAADDIILQRHVSYTAEDGREFGLIVANRRIAGVVAADAADLSDRVNEALAGGIDAGDEAALATLGAWFQARLDGVTRLRPKTAPLNRDASHGAVGVSVAVLAEALGVALGEEFGDDASPDPETRLEALIEVAGALAASHIVAEMGEITARSGEDAAVLAVRAINAPTGDPALTVQGCLDGPLVVRATAGERQCWCISTTADLPAFLKAWQGAAG